jgi:multidrug resistance efflux pump
MLALYGSNGEDYSWLIWVVVGLAVLLAIAVFAWWRVHRRTMSSRMNRARGKMNRAIGKTTGRV